MKVHVIKGGFSECDFDNHDRSNVIVHYCGYLDVADPFDIDLWDLCNWSCWAEEIPAECEHLLIEYCNSDIAYLINGEWYGHKMNKFNSFDECYDEMKNPFSHWFNIRWPIYEGFSGDNPEITLVTKENINTIIK